MITYYADDSVEITSSAVRVAERRFPLGELARVWHRSGRRNARVLANRGALSLAPFAPLVAAVALAVLALRLELTTTSRTVLLVVAGLLGLLTVPLLDLTLGRVERTYDRGTRVHEIWARWRGTDILLVRTPDRTRFGRIYRSLQRALDAADDATPAAPAAGRDQTARVPPRVPARREGGPRSGGRPPRRP